MLYENGIPKMLLAEAGFVSLSDSRYHYYLQDHQGNNRVVVDENGTVEEVNHYYPFGGTFASTPSVQPYKYNGKELDRKGGLDWYDYGARYYDAALGRWHVVEPSSEKYYSWSPYVYCKSNPVLRIDLNGKDDYIINNTGKLEQKIVEGSKTDVLTNFSGTKSITVNDKKLLSGMYKMQKEKFNPSKEFYNSTTNLEDAIEVFKFGADNTSVEWKFDVYDNDGSKTAIVGTLHKLDRVFADKQNALGVKGDKIVDLHSHPYNDVASDNDMNNLKIETGSIYFNGSKTKTLFFYNSQNSHIKNEDIIIKSSDELWQYLKNKFFK